MRKIPILLALLAAIIVVSCRQEADYVDNPTNILVNQNSTTFTTQFRTFWNVINTGYNFWDVTDIDWDARYKEYEPKFEALDRNYVALSEAMEADDLETLMALTDSLNKHYCDTLRDYYEGLATGIADHHMLAYFRNPYE